jgi:hypothetical protein
MNTMGVHDLHYDEDFPASLRHDMSSIGNVQPTCHGEPKNPLVIDVETMHDDASSITKMHLEMLQKQRLLWKPHYHISLTWVVFMVNNNQIVDLECNQIMRCIIFHSDSAAPEILTMHTRYKKGSITYLNFNGIITMKKRVEGDHYALMERLGKYPNCISLAKAPID